MDFEQFGLDARVLQGVLESGYTVPTPIQIEAIPHVMAGTDVLGCAQTGTGKTAAFALPVIHHLVANPRNWPERRIRALVLAPTRELAVQIGECFQKYAKRTKIRHTVILGGVNQTRQVTALERGVDVVIATPGRLLDLMNQGYVELDCTEVFVLDEADQMLDMGFLPDVERIIDHVPNERQTLFFSATMPPAISKLADSILYEPVRLRIKPEAPAAERIEQQVYFVSQRDKPTLLGHIVKTFPAGGTLVFSRTKYGADAIAKRLQKLGVSADALHGNKSQNARQRILGEFKSGKLSVLVATDIAARGIDVRTISHVINYDMPNLPETYVHRIGRTGRAGDSGFACSFCNHDERKHLDAIHKLLGQRLPVAELPSELGLDYVEASSQSSSNSRPTTPKGSNRSRPAAVGQSQNRKRRPNRSRTISGSRF